MASFSASDRVFVGLEYEERLERSRKSVTRKKAEVDEVNWPQPNDFGQIDGTAL